MHGQEGAVRRRLLVVGNVHAAKGARATDDVVAVDDMAIGKDVGKGAFLAKLAVSLLGLARALDKPMVASLW